jgi:hypothetical protein
MTYQLLQRLHIAKLYKDDEKLIYIQELYPGIAPRTIRRIAQDFGLTLRPQGRRPSKRTNPIDDYPDGAV